MGSSLQIIKVTIIAVEGPNIMRLASEIPKFTETLPAFGSGADKLSAIKISDPNSTTPNKDIFL
jgi:hypothetical protein